MRFDANIISIIANAIAIITFLFFLVGGVLSGIQNLNYAKRSQTDCFVWVNDSDFNSKFDFCHTLSLTEEKLYYEKLLVYCRERMYDFKVFSFQEYNEKNFKDSFSKEPLYDRTMVDPNECILIIVSIPGCMPTHLISWKTPTNMIGSLVISENGKEGNTTENIIYKHTLKSFVYYFFHR